MPTPTPNPTRLPTDFFESPARALQTLLEQRIDLDAAIEAADEDQLPALYAMRRHHEWQFGQWLDEAELVTYA